MTVDALPKEAEKLLAAPPDEFVAERKRLVQTLHEEGRSDDAATVARMRKPMVVVYAVNRAARDRPKAAQAAADAALRVKKAQLGGDPEAFKRALAELDTALNLLADVAVAHVARGGKAPTDTMRRRVRDLLRSAAADDETRDALARGALTDEIDAVGFSPFAGLAPRPGQRRSTPSRAKQQEAERRTRERELREELGRAESDLREADAALRRAERERRDAERAVAALRAKLDRID
ncbi:MAG: hypothetical protein ACRDNY_05425 [Gaiellaceae bacterium]